MDINEALARLREAMRRLRQWEDNETPHDDADAQRLHESDVAMATEHFEALDGSLTRGGFLPTDWERS